jgi:hypothetical protein
MTTQNVIADPLKVERSTVTKLVITGAKRLDPITVFLEDFGRRDCPIESNPNYQTAQGKITINCWDNSWNAYWGGMGPRTVAEFVADCDWHYVLNCLDRGISDTQFTGDALEALARKCILERRRGRNKSDWEEGSLDAEDARRLFNRVDELRNIESSNECWHQSELLTELFGEEWHYPVGDRAKEENHKFTYLRRVVQAVQIALRQEQQQVAA